jgi:hypothetical protein
MGLCADHGPGIVLGVLVGLVASGEAFLGGSGVAELDGVGGALVVAHVLAQVLGQGDGGLPVGGSVSVGDERLLLHLVVGLAAGEDQGEA